jgi:hypothetical protein
MKRFALAALAALVCSAALAQTYKDTNGTIVPGVVPLPYAYIPLSPGQHTLAITSSTALTVPAGARFANVCATTAAVRYTTDGTTTPTSTVGQPLAAAACVSLSGAQMIANFRALSATGTLDVEYFQ